MTDESDTSRPAADTELAEMRRFLKSARNLAIQRIREIAGPKFLEELNADREGEVIVQVALKSGRVRVQVRWPAVSPEIQTVSEFIPMPTRQRTQ